MYELFWGILCSFWISIFIRVVIWRNHENKMETFHFDWVLQMHSWILCLVCQINFFLTSFFLYWLARAREDTEKIDHNVKKKAERLHHIATVCNRERTISILLQSIFSAVVFLKFIFRLILLVYSYPDYKEQSSI